MPEKASLEPWEVGPSGKNVYQALIGAFFSFANTYSLVLSPADLAELRSLYTDGIRVFMEGPEADAEDREKS